MRIRMVLFAVYGDLAGTNELELDLPIGSTARDAVTALRTRGPAVMRIPPAPVVARNCAYAGLDEPLEEGDELALLPPVAGG